MQTLLFKNWTTEDFVGHWDGAPYKIKAGASIYLEDWKANHFAKHLVDRELQKANKEVNHHSRAGLLEKCIEVEATVEVDEKSADVEILNKNVKEEKVKPAKAKAKKKDEKPADDEFEGLAK